MVLTFFANKSFKPNFKKNIIIFLIFWRILKYKFIKTIESIKIFNTLYNMKQYKPEYKYAKLY